MTAAIIVDDPVEVLERRIIGFDVAGPDRMSIVTGEVRDGVLTITGARVYVDDGGEWHEVRHVIDDGVLTVLGDIPAAGEIVARIEYIVEPKELPKRLPKVWEPPRQDWKNRERRRRRR